MIFRSHCCSPRALSRSAGHGPIAVPGLSAVFPAGLPAIATSAVLGIVLNAVFLLVPPKAPAKS